MDGHATIILFMIIKELPFDDHFLFLTCIHGSLSRSRWFFGTMNRIEAQSHLMGTGNDSGAFLIRHSEKDHVGYVLSGETRRRVAKWERDVVCRATRSRQYNNIIYIYGYRDMRLDIMVDYGYCNISVVFSWFLKADHINITNVFFLSKWYCVHI